MAAVSLVGTYQSEQGSRLVKSLKRSIINLLPETTQFEFGITGSKLSTHFQIKNKTIFEHNHDLVYLGTCRENHCLDNYVGKSARRISGRIIDHSGGDQNSHPNTAKIDFKIISSGFKSNYCRRNCREIL